jgi:hypothetical protein
VDYLPFAETLILICFGLDSSRFAICKIRRVLLVRPLPPYPELGILILRSRRIPP